MHPMLRSTDCYTIDPGAFVKGRVGLSVQSTEADAPVVCDFDVFVSRGKTDPYPVRLTGYSVDGEWNCRAQVDSNGPAMTMSRTEKDGQHFLHIMQQDGGNQWPVASIRITPQLTSDSSVDRLSASTHDLKFQTEQNSGFLYISR